MRSYGHLGLVRSGSMKTELVVPAYWLGPLEEYLKYLVSAGRPRTTVYKWCYLVRRFAVSTALEPWAVTHANLTNYLASHQEWGPATRRSHSTALKAFYRWAYVMEFVRDDPTTRLPVVSVAKGRPRPAPESAVKIGKNSVDRRVRLMVELMADQGLRRCEVAVLSRCDVIENLIDHSLVVHGKGGKVRVIELNARLATLLLAMPEGYIFPGDDEGHISPGYVGKLVSRALPEGVTGHMLRHRLASVMFVGTNGDMLAVRDTLGHASVATTEIYTATPRGSARRGIDFAAAA